MVELELLGTAVIKDASGPITGPATHRHSLALLALLALESAGGIGRGRLVGYLWPEVSESTARNRLSTHLHRVRGRIGAETIRSTSGRLELDENRATSDVAAFLEALRAGRPEEAVSIYRGPFLEGFFLEGAIEFDRWMEAERQRLALDYRSALETLAARSMERGDAESAVRWWRACHSEAPFDSRLVAGFMEALCEIGNTAGALELAGLHIELLEREFGAPPPDEIEALVRRVRKARTASRDEDVELDPHAVAILPLATIGDDPEAAHFALGLRDDLLTRLSRSREIRVISMGSVDRLWHRERSIGELGRELGCGTVVEGRVRKAGERVRVNVHMVDVADDTHRWAESFDRQLTIHDLFRIQGELARRIADSLEVALDPEVRGEESGWPDTDDLEAYRLRAQGRARLDERTENGMRQAEALFRKALDRDPGYALGWTGLCHALALLYEYGYADEEVLQPAEAAARRAVELDPGSGPAHTSLGLIHEARREGPAAIREYVQAVRLQPSAADALNWMSWTYQNLGRADEALAASQKAVPLNPLAPETVGNLAISLLMTGRPDEALFEARRARSLQPDETTATFYEALALQRLGRWSEAGELLEDLAVPWAGSGPRCTLALVRLEAGDESRTLEIVGEFEGAEGGIDHASAGIVRAALGEMDPAFEHFDAVDRWPYWPTIPLHHHFPRLLAALRADARFERLIGRVRRDWGLNEDGSMPGEEGPNRGAEPKH